MWYTVIFTAPPEREARQQSREPANANTRLADNAGGGSLDGILSRVSLSLDKIAQRQVAALTTMEEKAVSMARAIGGVLSDPGFYAAMGAGGGAGAPMVALMAPRGDSG